MGRSLVLAGNVAIEDMEDPIMEQLWDVKIFGILRKIFIGGAEDEWLGDKRYGDSRQSLENQAVANGAYLCKNPEGPNGQPVLPICTRCS